MFVTLTWACARSRVAKSAGAKAQFDRIFIA
jgi:hypothetical protein